MYFTYRIYCAVIKQRSFITVNAAKISANQIFRTSGHCNTYLEITITKRVKLSINLTQHCNSVHSRITVASVWVQSNTKIQHVCRLLREMPICLRTAQPLFISVYKNNYGIMLIMFEIL